jgi:uncharacterized membrane protein
LESTLHELIDLVFRWVHLIAGIMWVGNSMLFNWLDRNLVKPGEGGVAKKEGLVGTIFMVHSGGFYEVEKKFLAPSQMPAILHWFKWQSYTTWVTGAALLAIVYYTGGGALMVDPSVAPITPEFATAIGVGVIVGSFVVYDLLWRSPLAKREGVGVAVSLAIACGVIWELTHYLSGRAAFIHVGAVIGTIMAGNVFFHIIPSQRELIAATKAGKPQDAAIANHAKQRSIHNNYLTFPLLFTMLSNHFGSVYGNKYNWLLLGILFVGSAGVRHFMNIRFTFARWLPALGATALVSIGAVVFILARPTSTVSAAPANVGERVSFTSVQLIIVQRCLPCHSERPTDHSLPAPPPGIRFDTPEEIQAFGSRIQARAVVSRTMPLANKTGMSDEERDLLARWFIQGAHIE